MSGSPEPGQIASMTPDSEACLQAAGALKACLLKERKALSGRDPQALEAAISEKARGLQAFAAALGAENAASATALRETVQTNAGGNDAAAERWQTFLKLAAECNDLNLSNGAAIRLRQRQVVSGIALLRGEKTPSETYGPRGAAADGSAGRPLTEA